jgi:transcriptional regulator
MNTEVERLKWRRNKVLELYSEGRSQPQIASILQVSLGTINRDLQILKRLAKANISKYINETLPLEYETCLIGLNSILSKTWDIANKPDSLERDRLQAISIGMQAYSMKIDLLSNATVVERAVHFVEKHRGLMLQSTEVSIDDTAKPE